MARSLVLAFALLLTGCASQITAFTHRPVAEDNVEDILSTVSLSADRRTVVVVTAGSNRGRFCAEAPPDTATGIKAELEADLSAKKAEIEAKLKLNDKVETNVFLLAQRTPALDAYRAGLYALCQFHLNGALQGTNDVKDIFLKLLDSFEAAQKKN